MLKATFRTVLFFLLRVASLSVLLFGIDVGWPSVAQKLIAFGTVLLWSIIAFIEGISGNGRHIA